jgi:hypothetical protein
VATESIVGQYALEGTCVHTWMTSTSSSNGGLALQGAGRRYNGILSIGSATTPGKVRVADFEGSSFLADQRGEIAEATNATSDSFPPGSSLDLSRIGSLEVLSFLMNRKDLSYRIYESLNSKTSTGSTITASSSAVCEGRLNGGALPTGTFSFLYNGTTQYSLVQPDSVELAALPGCTGLTGSGATDGSLLLHFGKDRNELIVYEEGMGCTVTATSQDGVVFHADGATCTLNDTGVSLLGVVSRSFDSYTIDLGKKTWVYSSTVMQSRSNGVPRPYCLKATTQLIGDVPQ